MIFNWYGFLMALGYLIAYLILRYLQRSPLSALPTDIDRLALALSVAAYLGARIGYFILYRPNLLLRDPLQVLRIYNGGMSFHGGLAALLACAAWYAYRMGLSYSLILDRIALCAPIGIFLGRIGNFINSELYGVPFQGSWAVVFSRVDLVSRHPSQLYEAATEGLLIFVALWCMKLRGALAYRGLLAGAFLVLYSLARFGCEFFRYPADGEIAIGVGQITPGQVYCLPFALTGGILLARAWLQFRRTS